MPRVPLVWEVVVEVAVNAFLIGHCRPTKACLSSFWHFPPIAGVRDVLDSQWHVSERGLLSM